jgi:hypothetical protein
MPPVSHIVAAAFSRQAKVRNFVLDVAVFKKIIPTLNP